MKGFAKLVALLVLVGTSASDAFYTNIVIDGAFDDWASVPVVATDPAGDDGGGPDLATLQMANDESNLYLRITYHAAVNPNASPSVFWRLIAMSTLAPDSIYSGSVS